MSKLEQLISELCPNGVEYVPLGEVATVTRGSGLTKSDFTESGVGCIHYGQIYTFYKDFVYETKSFVLPETAEKLKKVNTGDIVMAVTSENIEDVCKCVVWLGDDEIVTGGHTAIIKHNQNSKYLAYFFQSISFFEQKCKIAHGTKVIEVTPSKLVDIVIPLPPLPVQREIVRILDCFTTLSTELKALLTAETELRKKQYEYYRNELLTFGDDVPMVALGDVCIISAGGTPQKGNLDYWENGSIKWLGSAVCKNQKSVDEITGYITERGLNNSSARILKYGTTLIAMVGATIGKVAFLNFEATTNQNVAAVYPKDEAHLDKSYLFYSCQILYPHFLSLSSGGKLAIANLSFIRGLKIPIPPLPEQERIVAILDRFDALTTDITSGLPAEIAVRQKQYEYYRDKLLTFN